MVLLPPPSAVEVIESVPSVCLCVSVCVCNSTFSQLNRLTFGQEILHVVQAGSYLSQVRRSMSQIKDQCHQMRNVISGQFY